MSRMTAAKCFIVTLAIAGLGAPVWGQPQLGKGVKKTTVKKAPAKKSTPASKPKARTPKKAVKTSKPAAKPMANRPTPGNPGVPNPTTQPADTGETTGSNITPVVAISSGMANEQVAIQAALDNAGFSPGVIDGSNGKKTEVALRAYQAYSSLPVTGIVDPATRTSLGIDTRPATRPYQITAADQNLVAPPPRTWPEKARVKLLGYQSLINLAAERGHCTVALLGRLNPGVNLKGLKVGQTIQIPNISDNPATAKATMLEVDLGTKIIRAKNGDRVVGLYHCSIAADRRKRPTEPCKVASVVENPKYWFDPVNWPEVKNVKEKLIIPSGPRNPVGLCWIGLTKEGYGIHGTPEPENIGKTGSHGCFRLTNWDALRLAKMVDVGTQVRFSDETPPALAEDEHRPVTRVSTPSKPKPTKAGKTTRKGVPGATKNATIRSGK